MKSPLFVLLMATSVSVNVFLGLSVFTNVFAAPAVEKPSKAKSEMMHHRGNKAISIPLDDSADAVLWKPDLSTVPLTIMGGEVTLPKTGVDNYHAIVAKQQDGNTEKVVIRYVYRHGKPSGHSTSELTATTKADLEIVPDPVPREHGRYYSQQTWDFIVRFKGQPLALHPVMLNTANGSIMIQKSDESGRVKFKLPDDFSNIEVGERDRRKADLHVITQLTLGEEKWFTQLDSDYAVSESYWRFTFLGVIVMIIGFIVGVFLIRRNKAKAGQK